MKCIQKLILRKKKKKINVTICFLCIKQNYVFITNKIRSGEKYFVILAKTGGGGIGTFLTVRKRFVYLNYERQIK